MSGLFIKVGLDILDHPKFHAAEEESPGAISVWLWLTTYSRKHQLDGMVPKAVARKQCFISGDAFDARCHTLCSHKLLRSVGGSFEVVNYAAHNETREDIEKRREESRERMRRVRANKHRTSSEQTPNSRSEQLGAVPDSVSVSVSDLKSPEGEREREPDPRPSGTHPVAELVPDPTKAEQLEQRESQYRDAYERGISAGKRSPFAMNRFQQAELNQAIKTHAKRRNGTQIRGDDLLGWIEAAADDFASWLSGKPDKVSFFSSYQPRGFIKFLNEAAQAAEAKEVG